MINRVLIRSKVVQLVYSYTLNGGKGLEAAEKELQYSLAKAYDLYQYLLLLIPSITQYARKRIEAGKAKLQPTEEELSPNMKFVENKFSAKLETSSKLRLFCEKQKKSWDNSPEIIKSLYDLITASDIYKEYMASEETSFEQDREVWRKLYKTFISNNDDLYSFFEEQSLYWNDDKDIVDTFVVKTIKRIDDASTADQKLLPEFKDEEDREYALKLFRYSILKTAEYRQMISKGTRNWDLDRVAYMDVVIMQVAIAELLNFPSIPVNVTLNEYVDLAKVFGTPKSGAFVNGTLDGIVNQMKKDGKLAKI